MSIGRESGRASAFLFSGAGKSEPSNETGERRAGGAEGKSTVYRDIPEELKALIEPVIADHGCELMDLETVHGSGQTLLRITIDTPSGDGRVPVDTLADVSREVETQLDASDGEGGVQLPFTGAYQLEVSSPGLDRKLAREKDFAAACGEEVKLRTRRPLDGRRRFGGKLVSFEDVEKANTVYSFSSADFGGSGR